MIRYLLGLLLLLLFYSPFPIIDLAWLSCLLEVIELPAGLVFPFGLLMVSMNSLKLAQMRCDAHFLWKQQLSFFEGKRRKKEKKPRDLARASVFLHRS